MPTCTTIQFETQHLALLIQIPGSTGDRGSGRCESPVFETDVSTAPLSTHNDFLVKAPNLSLHHSGLYIVPPKKQKIPNQHHRKILNPLCVGLRSVHQQDLSS